jgi:3-deoxy-7-phosphoheptulonate synthase
MQMSLVLVKGSRRPIIRVGRFAGQYGKPRSKPTEIRDGVELPSYLGDIVNRVEFTAAARKPDPELLLQGYFHAAVALNYIRSLSAGRLSDLRRPEYFDLFLKRADLPSDMRADYQRLSRELSEGLQFLQAIGERSIDELMRVNFFTSHEGLNLIYESAQTRQVPFSDSYYDLTTHLPWIGERTRALDGAHIEFFRGIANPVGVKIGPSAEPGDVVKTVEALNPDNEPGKIVVICRFGVKNVEARLPPIVEAVTSAGLKVLWVSDPMHGNAIVSASGIKTRNFDDILKEVEISMDVHDRAKTYFGGIHLELTGDDVTECVGGGLGEEDLSTNYATLCDPRLNYRQAVQIAFLVARRLGQASAPPTMPPPPPSSRR